MSADMKVFKRLTKRSRQKGRQSIGQYARDHFDSFSRYVFPYIKIVIPNFIAAHYTYIVLMVILGSILIYPVKDMKYIDVLFLTGALCTQAGLNTVDLNKTSLYQQIVVYIFCMLTTPIFIHGSLLFIRLYWFERHFDNIQESSKRNFRMRRSATVMTARSQSNNPTMTNTAANQGLGLGRLSPSPNGNGKDSISSSSSNGGAESYRSNNNGEKEYQGEPSGTRSEDENREYNQPLQASSGSNSNLQQSRNMEGIRFGSLPQPPKRRQEIDPTDMYKSIAMLQDSQNTLKQNPEEDDVLVIKSPNEIERDNANPIFTKRQQFPFGKKRSSLDVWRPKKKWNKFKRTFSNSSQNGPRRSPKNLIEGNPNSTSDDESDADEQYSDSNRSIDSEDESRSREEHDDLLLQDSDNEDMTGPSIENNDDRHNGNVEKTQSNLVLPSSDATGGKKFGKRAKTWGTLGVVRSPTLDKLIKETRKKRLKKKILRSNRSFTSLPSSTSMQRTETMETTSGMSALEPRLSHNYLSWQPTIGRNSNFVDMTEEQKEELGGVEYMAIKLLIRIILVYYVGFHILAFVFLLPYFLHTHYRQEIRSQGVSPTWYSFFLAQSAFNDLGLTLTYNSTMLFGRCLYIMIIFSVFIIIGNTGFPVLLRFIIWLLFKVAHPSSLSKESLGFLLDHPRRCFTLLFPSIPTWWLFIILIVLNVVDWVLFIILDFNADFLKSTPKGFRVMQGLFQAVSTRTAGFEVLNLSNLHAAVKVSYLIMMYISVLPLAISIRRTNVYEEQSLGIYAKDVAEDDDDNTPKTFVSSHLRRQLSHDFWFLSLGIFIICICEGGKLNKGDPDYTIFAVMFEVVSAYGTVGLSLGYPTINTSLSGTFSTISKLVVIALMIRGRHRGLPYALDRAIILSGRIMARRDSLQEHHTMNREATRQTLRAESESQNEKLMRKMFRYGHKISKYVLSKI